MNILVCVKQVPDTDKITIDPVRHTLQREGAAAILNPYDANALEVGLRLRESSGGTVTVLTMGPQQAKSMLEGCIASGADNAFLITGKSFAGADTLATAYALTAAIAHMERAQGASFDLILCGKQTLDGDTAQVGPMLAELLEIPQITGIREADAHDGCITVLRQTSQGQEQLRCALPALITVSATPWPLRIPSLKSKLAARKKEIVLLDETLPELDLNRCGLKGSPTRVVSTAVRVCQRKCVMLSDTRQLARLLREPKGGADHAD